MIGITSRPAIYNSRTTTGDFAKAEKHKRLALHNVLHVSLSVGLHGIEHGSLRYSVFHVVFLAGTILNQFFRQSAIQSLVPQDCKKHRVATSPYLKAASVSLSKLAPGSVPSAATTLIDVSSAYALAKDALARIQSGDREWSVSNLSTSLIHFFNLYMCAFDTACASILTQPETPPPPPPPPAPIWDPVKKDNLLRSGKAWIVESDNDLCNDYRVFDLGVPAKDHLECSPPANSFRTTQAKSVFDVYQKFLDQHCKKDACQRVYIKCEDLPFIDPQPFPQDQRGLLCNLWKTTAFPQSLERILNIGRKYISHFSSDSDDYASASADFYSCGREKCRDIFLAGGEGNDYYYCVKTNCKEAADRRFKSSYPISSDVTEREWEKFQKKIQEICPGPQCVISDLQIEEAHRAAQDDVALENHCKDNPNSLLCVPSG